MQTPNDGGPFLSLIIQSNKLCVGGSLFAIFTPPILLQEHGLFAKCINKLDIL